MSCQSGVLPFALHLASRRPRRACRRPRPASCDDRGAGSGGSCSHLPAFGSNRRDVRDRVVVGRLAGLVPRLHPADAVHLPAVGGQVHPLQDRPAGQFFPLRAAVELQPVERAEDGLGVVAVGLARRARRRRTGSRRRRPPRGWTRPSAAAGARPRRRRTPASGSGGPRRTSCRRARRPSPRCTATHGAEPAGSLHAPGSARPCRSSPWPSSPSGLMHVHLGVGDRLAGGQQLEPDLAARPRPGPARPAACRRPRPCRPAPRRRRAFGWYASRNGLASPFCQSPRTRPMPNTTRGPDPGSVDGQDVLLRLVRQRGVLAGRVAEGQLQPGDLGDATPSSGRGRR